MVAALQKKISESATARWIVLALVAFTMLCGYFITDVMAPLKPMLEQQMVGLRAFLHFDLLRMFGPIYKDNPMAKRIAYRTEFNQVPKEMQSSDVVVDSIITDLKRAEILLTNTDPLNFEFPKTEDGDRGTGKDGFLEYRHKRMNLYAVKAMLARVYLYAGNKVEAANYASQVIEGKYFDLIG